MATTSDRRRKPWAFKVVTEPAHPINMMVIPLKQFWKREKSISCACFQIQNMFGAYRAIGVGARTSILMVENGIRLKRFEFWNRV